jgi:hypothetical protein
MHNVATTIKTCFHISPAQHISPIFLSFDKRLNTDRTARSDKKYFSFHIYVFSSVERFMLSHISQCVVGLFMRERGKKNSSTNKADKNSSVVSI